MNQEENSTTLAQLQEFRERFGQSGPANDIVLEQTENTDLLFACKPANTIFFNKVFGSKGSFWAAYERLGLGISPKTDVFMCLVGNRPFFCRNTSQSRVISSGLHKRLQIGGDDRIMEKTEWSFSNLMLALSAPFDQMTNVARMSVATARVGEMVEESSMFFDYSRKYYEDNRNLPISEPYATLLESTDLAAKAMGYSVSASLAQSINARLPKSDAVDVCASNELSTVLSANAPDLETVVARRFGYYSSSPYDLSLLRYSESPQQARLIPPAPLVQSPYLRWRENAKHAAACFLAISRRSLLEIARAFKVPAEDVFYLSESELKDCMENQKLISVTIARNKKDYNFASDLEYPQAFVFHNNNWMRTSSNNASAIIGTGVGAKKTASGRVVWVRSESDYRKATKGCIIFCEILSPNLVSLYGTCSAVVSSSGGILSHAAIVAREQEIPCVVKVMNIKQVKDGQLVGVDGESGKVSVLP